MLSRVVAVKFFVFCRAVSVLFLSAPSTGAPSIRPPFSRERESLNHSRQKGSTRELAGMFLHAPADLFGAIPSGTVPDALH